MKILIGLVFLWSTWAFAADYQDGDIIFHESQSNQSKAIREATNSRWSHVGILFRNGAKWYVAEAVQPVRLTALSSFIARGKNKAYRIYRLPGLNDTQKKELKEQVAKLLGQDYDIYFEWSDDLIYCSELVYKTFLKAAGAEIGSVQKYKDLKLDGPFVKELIRRRIKDTGRTLNLEESIVTPATQLEDPDLVLVEQSD